MAKPPTTATINTGNPDTANLAAAFLLNEGSGTTTKDYVNGTLLTLANGAAWSANGITMAAGSANVGVTTPAALKLTLPITVYLRLTPSASPPSDFVEYFGMVYSSSSGTSPFAAALIADQINLYAGNTNTAGSFVGMVSSTAVSGDAGVTIDLALVITSTGMFLYRNSTLIASDVTAFSNPTYDVTSRLGFGDLYAASRNPNCEAVFGYIWHGDMTSRLSAIQANPYALFSTPGGNIRRSSVQKFWRN